MPNTQQYEVAARPSLAAAPHSKFLRPAHIAGIQILGHLFASCDSLPKKQPPRDGRLGPSFTTDIFFRGATTTRLHASKDCD
eukprot:1143818-Pelagomonas_calceolata.AAC.6